MITGAQGMRQLFCVSAVAAAALLAGCDKLGLDLGSASDPEPAAVVQSPAPNAAAPMPDVGKLTTVATTAQGFGASPGEAVAQAMQLAILQVNGAAVQTESLSVKYGLDVSLNQDSASLRGSEFAQAVTQRSGGVIQNFKLLEMKEPALQGLLGSKQYKATIEAQIAQFKAPAQMQKIKLVIGQIRFDSAQLPMGDRSVPSAQVGESLRQRISDALVQTGRFAVLDREFSADIQEELDMIASGQAPSAELAKLSQAASADIIWSGRVSNLAYNRHARQLRSSDRELVSYSGGWAMTQKLVNVATRQVMASDALRGAAPSTAATTLGRGVDGAGVLQGMSTDLVNQVVNSVLRTTFPVTVVARDGTQVVLSQGGYALKQGARYAMVGMGAEMTDPQTGQSLGRMESACCELVVERVTQNLSYGRLENLHMDVEQILPGGLQLREQLQAVASAPAAASAQAVTDAPQAPAARPAQARPKPAVQAAPAAAAPAARDDDKW